MKSDKKITQYRVSWKGPTNSGHGSWMSDKKVVESWVRSENNRNPNYTHKLESRKVTKLQLNIESFLKKFCNEFKALFKRRY